ncbi:MAG: YfjI family protein [Defluviitaleaceae bacterium]|nr:YfjI family protein [Defluviitaleaceae bacterium]
MNYSSEKFKKMPRKKEQAITKKTNGRWQDLIPFAEEEETATFPINTLPKNIMKYVQDVSLSLNVPVCMPAMVLLGAMAIATQGKFETVVKDDWIEKTTSLFILNVASASSKKSPVFNRIMQPITDFENEINKFLKPHIAKDKVNKKQLEEMVETLQKQKNNAKRKSKGKEEEFKKIFDEFMHWDLEDSIKELSNYKELNYKRIIAKDITPEKIVSVMSKNNGTIAIADTEGGIFNKIISGGYSNNKDIDVDIYTKGYSGDQLKTDRIGREDETIDRPSLSMLFMVQNKVLDSIVNNDSLEDKGFIARLLFSVPTFNDEGDKFNTPPINKDIELIYRNNIKKLLSLSDNELTGEYVTRTVKLTKEAKRIFAKYYEDISIRQKQGDLKEIPSWAGKLCGNVIRIATILHLYELIEQGSIYKDVEKMTIKDIDANKITCAIQIGNYLIAQAKNVYGITSDGYAIRGVKNILIIIKNMITSTNPNVKKHINKNPFGEYYFTKRILKEKTRYIKNIDFEEVLSVMEEWNYIRLEEKQTSRTSINIIINPRIYNN